MSIISKDGSSTKSKKEKRAVYIYRLFEDLSKEDFTLDDVFNGLSLLFIQITEERLYSFNLMRCLTDQFAKGVARQFRIPLQTFKIAIKALEDARKTVDVRTMQHFWPLFRQLFLHVNQEELDDAISSFYGNKNLWDTGDSRFKIKPMVESYKCYQEEFELSRQFLIFGDFDDASCLWENCHRLCFYLMLQPKRGIKELTVASMRGLEALENLIKFFHMVPILISHNIANFTLNVMEPLAVGLVRHIRDTEISIMPIQEKLEFLERFISGITNDCIIGDKEQKFLF
ncbi:hypothetical protein Mgra_00000809 [Meloidogyne graminicola]|uniref:Uncharacterized protein n=1 Tax=Meloidogyne graminicola TaxID=189291 RepID=A0A8T0A3B6_9BILA|nr:hypothetical protein Mgra_00000809 [Meloidogyne graminicola]